MNPPQRQRNTTQMKEQIRNTEVQINEEEIGKLPEKEFRIMIVKMIKTLENKMEKKHNPLCPENNPCFSCSEFSGSLEYLMVQIGVRT